MTAALLLIELERVGASADLVGGRFVVRPARLLSPDLREALFVNAPSLVRLVRERDRERATAAAGDEPVRQRDPHRPPACACELRRFPDWRPDRVVRFCCEPDHRHEDGIPTYDSQECDDLLEFAALKNLRRLPVEIRNALLDLKVQVGGRIDAAGVPFAASALEDRQ